jgi:hypothetical protein
MKHATTTVRYYSGLDLGGPSEFTALATLEQTTTDYLDGKRPVKTYALRHLDRFPMGTTYDEVAAKLRTLFADEPLRDSYLAVDFTGVGRPVLDLLRKAGIRATFRPITVTAGHAAQLDGKGGRLVPKVELASVMQILLQGLRV